MGFYLVNNTRNIHEFISGLSGVSLIKPISLQVGLQLCANRNREIIEVIPLVETIYLFSVM